MILLNQILHGDVLDVLKTIPDNYVNCCVTSPPYWGLRDYGTEPMIWGGVENCKHNWNFLHKKPQGGKNKPDNLPNTGSNKHVYETDIRGKGTYSDFCSKCKAWRGSLGLEPTPELYVEHITEVFNEVKRVLKPDGTLWLNLGDSYAGSGKGGNPDDSIWKGFVGKKEKEDIMKSAKPFKSNNYKPKDLIGIPWMVAFALRATGWYLRSDIIWHKPNPMPESVTDRPTKSHEYIFLMSKSAKYYYDYEAIWEKATQSSIDRLSQDIENQSGSARVPGKTNGNMKAVGRIATKHTFGNRNGEHDKLHSGKVYERKYKNLQDNGQQNHTIHKNRLNADNEENYPVRNKRSVWTVTTKPYKDAHFATFPQELIIDCIKAGCPEGGIVLDPFMGAGTTALVARKLKRNYIGIELNEKYIQIANKRIEKELGILF